STCMSINAAKYKEIIALNPPITATNAPYFIPTCNAVLVAPAFLEPPFLIFICLYLLIICEPFIQPDKYPMSAINIGYNSTPSFQVYDILCKRRRYIVFIFIFFVLLILFIFSYNAYFSYQIYIKIFLYNILNMFN